MQVTIALSAYACNILFLYNSLSTAKHIQLRPTCVKVIFFLLHKSGTYRVLKHWQEASTVFNFQAAFRWFTERCTIMDVVSNDSYCLHSFLWKKQHKTSVSIGASCGLCKWFKWPEIFLQFLPPRSPKISFTVRSKGCPTMQYCRCVGKLIKSVVQIHKQTCWKKRWQNGRGSLNSLNMLHILLKGNTRGKKKNQTSSMLLPVWHQPQQLKTTQQYSSSSSWPFCLQIQQIAIVPCHQYIPKVTA